MRRVGDDVVTVAAARPQGFVTAFERASRAVFYLPKWHSNTGSKPKGDLKSGDSKAKPPCSLTETRWFETNLSLVGAKHRDLEPLILEVQYGANGEIIK